MMSRQKTAVVLVSSLDAVLPQVVASGLLCDHPGLVVVRHEIHAADHRLRRVVSSSDGVAEDVWMPLDHTCLTCALREDIVPTVARIAATGPTAIVLVLPRTTDPVPAVRALAERRIPGVRIAATVAALDGARFEWDLLGNDLLAERGLALTSDDRRSVGEAISRQVESADIIAVSADLHQRAAALLDHVVGTGPRRLGLHEVRPADVLRPAGALEWIGRNDPGRARPTGAEPRCGVWTLDLHSPRPFHPGRLLDEVERLGAGPLRARGYFWLPTRKGTKYVWDGVGGQLSVGDIGPWAGPPSTRIVVTGTERDPAEISAAFGTALMTETELAAGPGAWGADDWDDWLGPAS